VSEPAVGGDRGFPVKPARAPATPDRVLAVTKAQWAAFWSLAEKHAARLQEGARKRHRGPDPRTLLGMRPFEVGAASAGGQRGGGAAVDERKRRLRVASRLSSHAPTYDGSRLTVSRRSSGSMRRSDQGE
jgi:hypothetical protein